MYNMTNVLGILFANSHEEFIPVDQPQLYMIPVDHLPCGSYTVLIVGEQGNYQFDFYF